MTLDATKPIYFIGIAGTGMLPLAELAVGMGYKVFGSDVSPTSQLNDLQSKGAILYNDHQIGQIPNQSIVVYSSAIAENNIELKEARERSSTVYHRSDFLNLLIDKKMPITISGTHGKTTTTALISHMLINLGFDPTTYCGGTFCDTQKSSVLGSGSYFVAELDESDGTFLKFKPYINVITSIAADHLDYYHTLDSVALAFKKFIKNTDKSGIDIICWDDLILREISVESTQRITYGKSLGCDLRLLS